MLYELHILFILWNATQVFLYDYFRQLRDGGLCQRIFPQILLGRIYLHRILHCFPQLREVDVCQRIFASSCFTIAYLQSYLYGTNRKSLQFEHHIQKVLDLKRLIIGITIYNSVSPTWSTLYHWVLLFFFSPNSSSKNNRKKMMGSCRDRTSKRVKKVRFCFRLKQSLHCGSLCISSFKDKIFLRISLFIISRFKEKIYFYREIELVI